MQCGIKLVAAVLTFCYTIMFLMHLLWTFLQEEHKCEDLGAFDVGPIHVLHWDRLPLSVCLIYTNYYYYIFLIQDWHNNETL